MKQRSIVAITDSDKHFGNPNEEYIKRLKKIVDIKHISPYKHKDTHTIIQEETHSIIHTVEKKFGGYYKILLSKDGKKITTNELYDIGFGHNKIVFIIGGPYGLDEKKLDTIIDMKIGFGNITLPHGLAKLTLLEQLYRIHTIHIGKKYHY